MASSSLATDSDPAPEPAPEPKPEPVVLNDDCLQAIVEHTSTSSALFALARVSPALCQFVYDRLVAPPFVVVPSMSIYSHRVILHAAMGHVGARLGNQYVIYDGAMRVFTHTNEREVWWEFLETLPMLKRIFLLCCCRNLGPPLARHNMPWNMP